MNDPAAVLAPDRDTLLAAIDKKLHVVGAFMRRPWQIPYLKRRDPELVKAFSRIGARLLELRRCVELRPAGLPVGAALALVEQIIPKVGREGAWDLAEHLRTLVLFAASDDELEAAARSEKEPGAGVAPTWARQFGADDLDAVLVRRTSADTSVAAGWRELVLGRLAALYEARVDRWRHTRAQLQLRANYMFALTAMLGLVLFVSVIVNSWEGKWFTWPATAFLITAIASGALGSMLSGTYKLRDQAMSMRQLRSFWPAVVAQPFVGATAAMLVDAVVTSGIIRFGNLGPGDLAWQHHAIFGFLAGFSEPFFLGVVGKLTALETGRERVNAHDPADGEAAAAGDAAVTAAAGGGAPPTHPPPP